LDDLLLSLGSNVEPQRNIRRVVTVLERSFGEVRRSTVFESEAVGFVGDNFLNLVVLIKTALSVGKLQELFRQIEDAQGRNRNRPRYSERTIDIDILVYGECQGTFDGVYLPRREITENAHVLWPLSELIPEQIHPGENKSYRQLWQDYGRHRQRIKPLKFDWTDNDEEGKG